MPLVQAPPVSPAQISDIERFAKAYFGIELTREQLNIIDSIARGRHFIKRRQMGIHTVNNLIELYLLEGIKPDGRARLPQFELPAHLGRTKLKNKTQHGRVLEMIKRPGGAFNFELSRISLRYGGTIFELRKDGHNIVTERQYLKNGKASNTFLYRIAGQ